MEVSAPPAPRLFDGHAPTGSRVWARFLYERYACLPPAAPGRRVALRPGAGRSRRGRWPTARTASLPLFEPLAAAILARIRTMADAAPRRRDHLARAGTSAGTGTLQPRLAVDLGQHATPSTSTSTPRAAPRSAYEALRREPCSAYGPRLRPLQRLQEAGAPARGASSSLAWCWSPSARRDLYPLRRRPGAADAVVPGMDRAHRRALPPQRGARLKPVTTPGREAPGRRPSPPRRAALGNRRSRALFAQAERELAALPDAGARGPGRCARCSTTARG